MGSTVLIAEAAEAEVCIGAHNSIWGHVDDRCR